MLHTQIERASSTEVSYGWTQTGTANTNTNLDQYMETTERNMDSQQVPRRNSKRSREVAYIDHVPKRKNIDNPNNERYLNRFSIRNPKVTNPTEQLEEHVNNTEDKVRKPPPVYIENVVNYPSMINHIQTTTSKDRFVCKTFANNSVKVNTKSADSYRKLIHPLKQGNVEYYTYQPRVERAYRVVIKNLHATITTDDIKDELQSIGFKIRNVVHIRN